MKNLKEIKLLYILFILGLITTACVQDDDYSIPEIDATEPIVAVNTNIATVKSIYNGYEPKIIEAGEGSSIALYLEAYVVSSDESGNFYKSLIIQDATENPTAGIAISTNATALYTKYEPGRKIYFRVDGLYSGEYAGLPTIGTQDGDEIGRISIEDFESRILRSLEKIEIIPQLVTIEQATNNNTNSALLNTLVKFENVQFPEGSAGIQHYGDPGSTYSVNRDVENCDEERIILRTSGYADFKGILLPTGNGTLKAILSRFNNDIQLFINDPDDVTMNDERCDNSTGGGTGGAVALPFTQNFENQNAGTGMVVNIEGWTNVNVNGGLGLWEVREFNSNRYAQSSARNSNENPYETWLVTPGLILPNSTSPTLTFETNDGYNNGAALTVKISTDFDGDVTTATWNSLNATISTGNSSGYGANFTPSGDVDLSTYAGQTVYIAYRYLGASNGTTTTYQIDNIAVVE
jgi:hypothetical protein